MNLSPKRFFSFLISCLHVSSQIGATGKGTVNTTTQATATSHGRETDTIPTTRIATRTIMAIDVHMETRTAAQAATATTAPLEKGRTTSTAMTETTEVIDRITTGKSYSELCLNISAVLCHTTGLKHAGINHVSGIRTPKEDVAMNSVPTTTREGKALFRTSGGCRSTGQHLAHLGRSTTAGPTTPTNLFRCWTLAPRRLRNLHRTPVLHLSGP